MCSYSLTYIADGYAECLLRSHENVANLTLHFILCQFYDIKSCTKIALCGM